MLELIYIENQFVPQQFGDRTELKKIEILVLSEVETLVLSEVELLSLSTFK